MSLLDDPRLRILRQTFTPGAEIPVDRPDPDADRIEAAVSLILRAGPELDVLLIKRAEHDRDPWSGHMALPGGRWEDDDANLLQTATRETMEETGVDLAGEGLTLGRLDEVAPSSPRLPSMRIVPYVFAVPEATRAAVASHELERVEWVAVDRLRHPETADTVRIHFSGYSRQFPSYRVSEDHVWGLTHRILRAFLARYPDDELSAFSAD